ncbi:MAG: DUF4835 family protein [Bacteroidota bacterium]
MRTAAVVVLALVAASGSARAQELNCEVAVTRPSVSGPEYAFLDDLRPEVFRYLNNRPWTEDAYQTEERIDCSVQITITDAISLSSFSATIAVQASRPIYGTAQRTITLLTLDQDWNFNYTRGQPLIYDPNRFDSFTSVLDYYANLILGYDYDTFSELGGTLYFERARQIADLGRSSSSPDGWGSQLGEDRTRFDLVQDLLDPVFEPLRRAHFTYHFAVLDQFVIQPQQAWEDALAMLGELHELYLQFNRRRYATDLFYAAKYQELTQLLEESPLRNEAYALLSEMDAAHIGTYDALVNAR